ncbi:MAG: prepilin-type N-terminal cleavage/methylation domain-containing protein, partial [Bacilli bacterium]|nr:prepilin-type N-terminal cleavage/methylation domain-containing protein [Bacilli bacterium]
MQPGGRGLENKAFTLIELLAVIIIIGVIALIATPIIINTIGKGKKASFGRSIDGLIKSVEIDYSEDSFLAPREYFYEKRDLTLLTVEEKMRDEEIEIQGKIDGNGFIYVDEEGNIYIDNICDKEYCANGPEDDIVITPNPDGEIPSHSKTEP